MGCGVSLVAAKDSTQSYRVTPKTKKQRQKERALTNQSAPYSHVDILPGKAWLTAKHAKEKERKEKQKKQEEDFLTEAVNAHNEYRALRGVPDLKISASLSAHAQTWAEELARKDMMIHSKCALPDGEQVGENIYTCWLPSEIKKLPARDAVRAWYIEQDMYDYNKASFSYKTGHFTQVVWKSTKSLGIAWAQSNEGNIYVVANYSPAGNINGAFEQNVQQPCNLENNQTEDSFD